MSLNINFSNTVYEEDWNKNLQKSPASNIYQVPSYLDVYQQAFDSKPLFLTIERDGNVIGQLSALIHTKYYWRNSNFLSKSIGTQLNLNSILRWEYGPIVHDLKISKDIMNNMLLSVDELALKNKVNMIQGTVSPLLPLSSSDPFREHGYSEKLWGTYVTNLNIKIDDLYSNLSKETRYDIRKGEKNELEFVIADNFKEYDELVNLTLKVKRSRGQLARKNALFNHKFWDILHDRGYLKIFQIKKNGELLGGMEVLNFNNNVLQYGVSISEQGQKLQAGSFLTWNVIKWAISMKYKTFDLSGVNPTPGIEKEHTIKFFKSKWCGQQLNYVRYVKIIDKFKLQASTVLSNPRKLAKITSIIN